MSPRDPLSGEEHVDPTSFHGPVSARPVPLWAVIPIRLTLNTTFRVIYPFLPAISRGLGISVTQGSWLLTLRLAAGMVAPLLGPISDHIGRRRTMELGLLLFVLGGALLAGVGTWPAAALAFILYGLAKVLYDPALYAYLTESVPYERRGRAIGAVELAWSGAWFLGVPATGFLIDNFGWRAPWMALAVLGLFGLALTRFCLPPVEKAGATRYPQQGMLDRWGRLLKRPAVRALLATSFLLCVAVEAPFIIYGAWMEERFGLSLVALGLSSTVIGLAEAAGEFGTMTITDRLGKKRSVLLGLLGLAGSLALLEWLAGLGLAGALAGVALMLLFFEFAIVSLLPLISSLTQDDLATLFSLHIVSLSLGRIVGGLAGGWLWSWGTMGTLAALGAGCALLAALILARGVPAR